MAALRRGAGQLRWYALSESKGRCRTVQFCGFKTEPQMDAAPPSACSLEVEEQQVTNPPSHKCAPHHEWRNGWKLEGLSPYRSQSNCSFGTTRGFLSIFRCETGAENVCDLQVRYFSGQPAFAEDLEVLRDSGKDSRGVETEPVGRGAQRLHLMKARGTEQQWAGEWRASSEVSDKSLESAQVVQTPVKGSRRRVPGENAPFEPKALPGGVEISGSLEPPLAKSSAKEILMKLLTRASNGGDQAAQGSRGSNSFGRQKEGGSEGVRRQLDRRKEGREAGDGKGLKGRDGEMVRQGEGAAGESVANLGDLPTRGGALERWRREAEIRGSVKKASLGSSLKGDSDVEAAKSGVVGLKKAKNRDVAAKPEMASSGKLIAVEAPQGEEGQEVGGKAMKNGSEPWLSNRTRFLSANKVREAEIARWEIAAAEGKAVGEKPTLWKNAKEWKRHVDTERRREADRIKRAEEKKRMEAEAARLEREAEAAKLAKLAVEEESRVQGTEGAGLEGGGAKELGVGSVSDGSIEDRFKGGLARRENDPRGQSIFTPEEVEEGRARSEGLASGGQAVRGKSAPYLNSLAPERWEEDRGMNTARSGQAVKEGVGAGRGSQELVSVRETVEERVNGGERAQAEGRRAGETGIRSPSEMNSKSQRRSAKEEKVTGMAGWKRAAPKGQAVDGRPARLDHAAESKGVREEGRSEAARSMAVGRKGQESVVEQGRGESVGGLETRSERGEAFRVEKAELENLDKKPDRKVVQTGRQDLGVAKLGAASLEDSAWGWQGDGPKPAIKIGRKAQQVLGLKGVGTKRAASRVTSRSAAWRERAAQNGAREGRKMEEVPVKGAVLGGREREDGSVGQERLPVKEEKRVREHSAEALRESNANEARDGASVFLTMGDRWRLAQEQRNEEIIRWGRAALRGEAAGERPKPWVSRRAWHDALLQQRREAAIERWDKAAAQGVAFGKQPDPLLDEPNGLKAEKEAEEAPLASDKLGMGVGQGSTTSSVLQDERSETADVGSPIAEEGGLREHSAEVLGECIAKDTRDGASVFLTMGDRWRLAQEQRNEEIIRWGRAALRGEAVGERPKPWVSRRAWHDSLLQERREAAIERWDKAAAQGLAFGKRPDPWLDDSNQVKARKEAEKARGGADKPVMGGGDRVTTGLVPRDEKGQGADVESPSDERGLSGRQEVSAPATSDTVWKRDRRKKAAEPAASANAGAERQEDRGASGVRKGSGAEEPSGQLEEGAVDRSTREERRGASRALGEGRTSKLRYSEEQYSGGKGSLEGPGLIASFGDAESMRREEGKGSARLESPSSGEWVDEPQSNGSADQEGHGFVLNDDGTESISGIVPRVQRSTGALLQAEAEALLDSLRALPSPVDPRAALATRLKQGLVDWGHVRSACRVLAEGRHGEEGDHELLLALLTEACGMEMDVRAVYQKWNLVSAVIEKLMEKGQFEVARAVPRCWPRTQIASRMQAERVLTLSLVKAGAYEEAVEAFQECLGAALPLRQMVELGKTLIEELVRNRQFGLAMQLTPFIGKEGEYAPLVNFIQTLTKQTMFLEAFYILDIYCKAAPEADRQTLDDLAAAYAENGYEQTGLEFLAVLRKSGATPHPLVIDVLVQAYGLAKLPALVEKVLETMAEGGEQPDAGLLWSVATAVLESGDVSKAAPLFAQAMEADPPGSNQVRRQALCDLLKAQAEAGNLFEAWEVLRWLDARAIPYHVDMLTSLFEAVLRQGEGDVTQLMDAFEAHRAFLGRQQGAKTSLHKSLFQFLVGKGLREDAATVFDASMADKVQIPLQVTVRLISDLVEAGHPEVAKRVLAETPQMEQRYPRMFYRYLERLGVERPVLAAE